MITESFYGIFQPDHKSRTILITVPHGASGEGAFFNCFPEIKADKEVAHTLSLFNTFLAVEQDRGSSEMAHRLATHLAVMMPEVSIIVLEPCYPRGLLDGGRNLEHCVRPFLPDPLLQELTPKFRALHKKNLAVIRSRLKTARESGGLVVDMHTMAACCPADDVGKYSSWSGLERYVRCFQEYEPERQRHFDLITADGQGNELAPSGLVRNLELFLSPHLEIRRSEPYAALEHFLMNELMRECPGVAIDIPKNLVAEDGKASDLESFKLSWEKIESISYRIACGVSAFLGETANPGA